MDTTLIFVRHGQSEANTDKYFAGHYDAPLTTLGLEQAEKMAEFLKEYPITAVFSSDLSRASDTALPIASYFGLSIKTDKRLREVHAGAWQQKSFSYLESNIDYKHWRTGASSFAPKGGEAIRDLFLRVDTATQEIVQNHPGETVAIVTHATPIRVLQTKWKHVPLSALSTISSPPNASVTIVCYKEDGTQEILLDGENRFLGALSKAATTQM